MAKASIYLDKRHKNKDKEYPIKIRVTNGSDRKYYSTGFYIGSQQKLEKLLDVNTDHRGDNKIIKEKLIKILKKAKKNIKKTSPFNYPQFESLFLQNKSKIHKDVFASFDFYITKLQGEGRASTASSYNVACKSIRSFLQKDKRKKKLEFSDITVDWLNKYEDWMKSQGNSHSTIGIYLRNLRRLYNLSLDAGKVSNKQYPFGKDKYTIPSSVNHKRALTLEQVNKIYHLECLPDTQMERFRDFWIFSYLCQGMNFRDIAKLRWPDLETDKLRFIRQKTANKNKAQLKKVVIYLEPAAKRTIEKWGNQESKPQGYIFPFYKEGISEERKLAIAKQQVKNINRWMKKIGKMLEFDITPTFYFARHSYATIMRNTGASIELISEALGHNDIKTTRNYLESFEEDKIRKHHSNLLSLGENTELNVVHKAG